MIGGSEFERKCKQCHLIKPLTDFEPGKRYKNGRMPVCRLCRRLQRENLYKRERVPVEGSKLCRRCDRSMGLGEFQKDRRSPDGYSPQCKSCRRRYRSKEDPRVSKDRMMRWKFGISLDEFEEMIKEQEGRCAACGDLPSSGKVLHLDHCHKTGRIRRPICGNCNTALGLLKESPKKIHGLLAYIGKVGI